MDTECAEDSKIVKMLFGFALVALCMGIGAHTVLDRELARLGESMTESDMVVENVDEIVDDLNRLDISMRAFLSAGDGRFSDDVVLSVTAVEVHMESLQQVAVKRRRFKRSVARLNHMVKLTLDSAGKPPRVRHALGTGNIIASLDQTSALACARIEAAEVKDEARQDVLSVIHTQRGAASLLDLLL